MNRIYAFLLAVVSGLFCIQCTPQEQPQTPGENTELAGGLKPSAILRKVEVHTDKSCYAPGEQVSFTADKVPGGYVVRYWHLGDVLKEEPFSSETWTWTPPADDFKGYFVEIVGMDKDGHEKTMGAVAFK